MKCRYCDKNPRLKEICGQCQEHYKEDRFGRPDHARRDREQKQIEQVTQHQLRILGMILLAIIAVLVIGAVAALYVFPTTVRVECQAGEWEELPPGLEWGGGIKMAPNMSHCSASISGPTFVVARILAGIQ